MKNHCRMVEASNQRCSWSPRLRVGMNHPFLPHRVSRIELPTRSQLHWWMIREYGYLLTEPLRILLLLTFFLYVRCAMQVCNDERSFQSCLAGLLQDQHEANSTFMQIMIIRGIWLLNDIHSMTVHAEVQHEDWPASAGSSISMLRILVEHHAWLFIRYGSRSWLWDDSFPILYWTLTRNNNITPFWTILPSLHRWTDILLLVNNCQHYWVSIIPLSRWTPMSRKHQTTHNISTMILSRLPNLDQWRCTLRWVKRILRICHCLRNSMLQLPHGLQYCMDFRAWPIYKLTSIVHWYTLRL